MNLNPFTFFGLLGSREVATDGPKPNGGSRTNGASGRATLLTAPQQATVDTSYGDPDDEATIALREEREAAQAKLASTSIQLDTTLDELLAQQARDAEARG